MSKRVKNRSKRRRYKGDLTLIKGLIMGSEVYEEIYKEQLRGKKENGGDKINKLQ